MNLDKYLKDLFEFLAIPSISAHSEHKKDMQRASNWLEAKLKSLGFVAKTMPTKGHAVVYAENPEAGRGKPTILVYGHYDVQAVDPLNEWLSDPFKPEIRRGNIYARGTADDKGQLYTWIAAIEQILSKNKRLPVNIKFLIEGEEEMGSRNLDEFVTENKRKLKADVCVISDSHALNERQPMISYGLRGLAYTEIIIRSLTKDAHSGLYGGNVLNPATVLTQIIAKLKDDSHKVLIPGFYDKVRKLTDKERKELKRLPFTEKDILKETGAKIIAGEKGYSVHERAGARPTLDVNGIWGGYTNEGPKTIIPAVAHAKISMRLVPHQNSNDIFKKFGKYVREITPRGVELNVDLLSTAEPILINTDSVYFKAAEEAYKKTFKTKPVYELSGGSIPITATFKDFLGIDSILMGYGLPDDGLHSPNEKLSLKMFEKGIKTNIEFLTRLGDQSQKS